MNQEIEWLRAKIVNIYTHPYYSKFVGFIKKLPSDKDIIKLEKKLEVKLSEDYKWWLKHYNGPTFLTADRFLSIEEVIKETLVLREHIKETRERSRKFRKFEDPSPYLVAVERSDEWHKCLNLKTMKKGICKVIMVDRHICENEDYLKPAPTDSKSFFHFLYRTLKYEIDGFEDDCAEDPEFRKTYGSHFRL